MDLKLVKMEAVLVGESGLIQMTLKAFRNAFSTNHAHGS